MSDYNDARNFFDAFMGRTWQYSTDVKLSLQGTVNNIWEYISEKNNPSELKRAFINEMKESAEMFENEGYGIHIRTANAIREILDEIIPQYMDDDEEEEECISTSDESSSFLDPIREKAKKYDIDLAGQFVAESMTGGISYKPINSFSDSDIERAKQQQYSHYCLKAKSNIASDSIGTFAVNPSLEILKESVLVFIYNNNKEHPEMRPLFESNDDNVIIRQISLLSFMSNMADSKDINNVTDSEFNVAFNQGTTSILIGLYTYFTIIVNQNYSSKDFNKLFVESWIDYYNNFKPHYIMLRKKGNNWKEDLKGTLLSD